jgi:hypothetical protein
MSKVIFNYYDTFFKSLFKDLKRLSESDTFSGDAVRASLFSTCLTAPDGKQIILKSLEGKGMILDDKHRYKLQDIQAHFANLFGQSMSAVIFENVKQDLVSKAH